MTVLRGRQEGKGQSRRRGCDLGGKLVLVVPWQNSGCANRRGGLSCPIWLVSCSPILAMYFYLLCRSRHSSQTCIGIGRFRKQADVLVTTTPKSKKFQIEATLLRNRGDLPSVTLVEQVLRDVCRFVSATQHACKDTNKLFRADTCTKNK